MNQSHKQKTQIKTKCKKFTKLKIPQKKIMSKMTNGVLGLRLNTSTHQHINSVADPCCSATAPRVLKASSRWSQLTLRLLLEPVTGRPLKALPFVRIFLALSKWICDLHRRIEDKRGYVGNYCFLSPMYRGHKGKTFNLLHMFASKTVITFSHKRWPLRRQAYQKVSSHGTKKWSLDRSAWGARHK